MKTLKYAKQILAPFINITGDCPDSAATVAAINEASELLMVKLGNSNSAIIQPAIFYCYGNVLTLPRGVDRIIRFNINNIPQNTVSKYYEFLPAGAGEAEYDHSGFGDLIDQGESPTTYSFTDGMPALNLAVYSDSVEAEGVALVIRGRDEFGKEITTDIGLGESIDIIHTSVNSPMVISTKKFSRIDSIVKPVTNGYIYLDAFDISNGDRFNMSVYHPDEEYPSYRRYKLKGWNFTTDVTTSPATYLPITTQVKALVARRFIPLSHDSDPLPIDNIPALKKMIQALGFYDMGQVKMGTAYESLAGKLLADSVVAYDAGQEDQTLEIQGETWAESNSLIGGIM